MADSVTDEGMKFVLRDVKESYDNSKVLLNRAMIFINELNTIIQTYNHGYKLLLQEGSSFRYITEIMQRNEQKMQEIIKAQYQFQSAVNDFLGRSIHFAWVSSKGEVFFTSETSAEKIYASASLQTTDQNKNKGKLSSIDINSLGKLVKNSESFMKEAYQNQINDKIAAHQSMYQDVVKRLNKNKDSKNLMAEGHFNTVYWDTPEQGPKGAEIKITKLHKWTWSHKVSEGDLAEGLINFIFNSKKDASLNIGTFMLKWVEAHNSIPGITKGDIVVKGTYDKVQIAVKATRTFDTASIGPYLRAAYTIITFADKLDQLTMTKVKDILNNVPRYSIKIEEKAKLYLEEKTGEIILKAKEDSKT